MSKGRWSRKLSGWLVILVLLVGCKKQNPSDDKKQESKTRAPAKARVIKVYTHRHYPADKQLFAKFQKDTGVKVEVIQNKADALLKRLEIQGKNADADVLITVDVGRLARAQKKGLLQPISSKVLEKQIPAHLRDPKGFWFGLTQRARVVVYAKDRIKPADLSTYEALTDKKWKGKILVRSSNNIYNQSLLASIIAHKGKEKALAWAKGLVANMARKPKGNDRGQMKAIAAGVGDLAIVNTYYVGLMQSSKDEKQRKVAAMLGVFFPNQKGRGTHVNISGAGIGKYAKNKADAIKFLEFLSSEAAQDIFAKANYEYPVNPKVKAAKLVRSWGDFKADKIVLQKLGDLNKTAVELFDQAGWR